MIRKENGESYNMKQKIEYIRRNLIDEESRQLFDNRVKYYYERDIIDLMKNVQIIFYVKPTVESIYQNLTNYPNKRVLCAYRK